MKLLFVVLHLGKSKLEVTVEDDGGHRRRVGFVWHAKEQSDIAPAHWPESIVGELAFQDAEAHNEAMGRKPPPFF